PALVFHSCNGKKQQVKKDPGERPLKECGTAVFSSLSQTGWLFLDSTSEEYHDSSGMGATLSYPFIGKYPKEFALSSGGSADGSQYELYRLTKRGRYLRNTFFFCWHGFIEIDRRKTNGYNDILEYADHDGNGKLYSMVLRYSFDGNKYVPAYVDSVDGRKMDIPVALLAVAGYLFEPDGSGAYEMRNDSSVFSLENSTYGTVTIAPGSKAAILSSADEWGNNDWFVFINENGEWKTVLSAHGSRCSLKKEKTMTQNHYDFSFVFHDFVDSLNNPGLKYTWKNDHYELNRPADLSGELHFNDSAE
ncbi:MAG TPA: hypothetical protein VFU15_15530, partial [Bacteroidia bacterium]|nr:hypothetical protein [Bacteroidia bacterium]